MRRVLLALAILAVSIEIALQLASLVVVDRSGSVRQAPITILCVGDSHTYGGMVKAEESYPGWLQRMLDRVAPGRFAVVNAGVPGANTAIVRRRLPILVERYHPQMILVWVGINDGWNMTDVAPAGWSEHVDALASRSRLYRLVRVRINDWKLDHTFAIPTPGFPPNDGGGLRPAIAQTPGLWDVQVGDKVEHIVVTGQPWAEDDAMRARAADNYARMIVWAKGAGIPIAFLAYPADFGGFRVANTALRATTAEARVPLIETTWLAQAVPQKRRVFLWAAHPNAWMYRSIAHSVATLVRAHCRDSGCR